MTITQLIYFTYNTCMHLLFVFYIILFFRKFFSTTSWIKLPNYNLKKYKKYFHLPGTKKKSASNLLAAAKRPCLH